MCVCLFPRLLPCSPVSPSPVSLRWRGAGSSLPVAAARCPLVRDPGAEGQRAGARTGRAEEETQEKQRAAAAALRMEPLAPGEGRRAVKARGRRRGRCGQRGRGASAPPQEGGDGTGEGGAASASRRGQRSGQGRWVRREGAHGSRGSGALPGSPSAGGGGAAELLRGWGGELRAAGAPGSHLRPPLRPLPPLGSGTPAPCPRCHRLGGAAVWQLFPPGVAKGRAGGWESCLFGVLVGVTQSLALLERLLGCGYTLGGGGKAKRHHVKPWL